jgi:hypothetical protein
VGRSSALGGVAAYVSCVIAGIACTSFGSAENDSRDGAVDAGENDGGEGGAEDAGSAVGFGLPCTPGAPGTAICDGFEGRQTVTAPWRLSNKQDPPCAISILDAGGAGSPSHVRFVSSAKVTGVAALGQELDLPRETVWVSVDVRLSYSQDEYTQHRRNLIGIYGLTDDGMPHGFAGVSLTQAGVVAESILEGVSGRTQPLEVFMNGADWHRVELELVLAPNDKGRLRVWVDDKLRVEMANQATMLGLVDRISFSIAANANPGEQPALTADYDNVALRFAPRP